MPPLAAQIEMKNAVFCCLRTIFHTYPSNVSILYYQLVFIRNNNFITISFLEYVCNVYFSFLNAHAAVPAPPSIKAGV